MSNYPVVYVVTGEHPEIPGMRVTVHETLVGANAKAAELVNFIAESMNTDMDRCGVQHVATSKDWQDTLKHCQSYYGAPYCNVAQYCNVDITTVRVES